MIFEELKRQVSEKGALTRADLADFSVAGQRRRLIDQNKGIWNPRDLQATLSILSKPDSQYSDEEVGDGLFSYDYREGNPEGDNTKLRRAFELQLPLILLRWIKSGVYVPVFPAYVIADDPVRKRFLVALDERLRELPDPQHLGPVERAYAERITRQRLHQPEFRAKILLAYASRCSICQLGHVQLLDAAHIIADNDARGLAEVSNGLCLCKLHHAAYDANLLGISPKHVIHISEKIKRDPSDSPVLTHSLRDFDGRLISLPAARNSTPSPERLAERFETFKEAS